MNIIESMTQEAKTCDHNGCFKDIDFLMLLLPALIEKAWENTSFEHDSCASYSTINGHYQLFIDYPFEADRECPEKPRFNFALLCDGTHETDMYATNDPRKAADMVRLLSDNNYS